MTRLHSAILGVLAPTVLGVTLLQADETGRQPLRSGVEVVALTVTVQHSDGSFPTELGVDDFAVFENGVKQSISFFNNGTAPVDLALLVDSSASMHPLLPALEHAVSTLIESLTPSDRASVMTFGGAVRQKTPFTGNHAALLKAMRDISAGGTTPLFDAVYIALRTFERAPSSGEMKRRALVVFTDGDDTASLTTYDTVLETAREAGIAVYAVILKTPTETANARSMQNDFQMRRLSQETGGRVMVARDEANLDPLYKTIATELAHQYSLGYVPLMTLGQNQFTRVAVTVRGRNLTVRTRSGYMARR